MDLEQLSNEELIERFEAIEPVLGDAPNPEVVDALATLGDLDGFQDADNSRQIMIDYIREEEESQQPRSKRRTEGGKRRTSRRSRRSRKSRKSRRGRKSRKSRRGRSRRR
jgi:hypothetical protein